MVALTSVVRFELGASAGPIGSNYMEGPFILGPTYVDTDVSRSDGFSRDSGAGIVGSSSLTV